MRFTAEHRFAAPPAAVAAVLGDPDFYRTLDLPDLRLLEIRTLDSAAEASPGSPGLLLRYEYSGSLDPAAQRLLGGARLTWAQEVRLRGASGGSLTFAAESKPGLLHGDAEFTLEADGTGTVRRLEGELVIAVPVLGGVAERRIVPGVVHRLDVEALAVSDRLKAG